MMVMITMYLNKQINKNYMKNNLLLVFTIFLFVSSFSLISALDSLGSSKVNEQYIFCQVCADATYIRLSSIQTPTNTNFIDSNMTPNGTGQYCYSFTPTEVGRYDFKGISDGCDRTFATYLEVTPSGFTNTVGFTFIILLVFICLIGLGFWIKDGWFVVFGGLGLMGFGVYSIINGIAGFKDDLVTWGTSLFFIGVGAYLSINSAIEMINESS